MAFIFNNLAKHGDAIISIEFISVLPDIITVLANNFKICKLINDRGVYYLELEYFTPKKNNLIIEYIKYLFAGGMGAPFYINPDRNKIRELIKKI